MKIAFPFPPKYLLLCLLSAFATGVSGQAPVFYGMTSAGGLYSAGTIFSFNAATNTDSVLWSFGTGTDGQTPYGSLAQYPGTNLLYGMTYRGGANSYGAIISFDLTGNTEAVAYSFAGLPDGEYPWASLTYLTSTGLFYGTTTYGGSAYTNGSGVIFSFNPATGTDSVLWKFSSPTDTTDGKLPTCDFTYSAGSNLLYGTTSAGGANRVGAIFSYNLVTGEETLLYSFLSNGTDGQFPEGELSYYPAGNIYYGLTEAGGTDSGGTIFSFDPAGNTERVLWNFGADSDGTHPGKDFVYLQSTGLFYAVTARGGSHAGGAIISFNPTDSTESVLWNFGLGSDGHSPAGNLVYDPTYGLFYGMTYEGGTHGQGTIYTFNPSTPAENVVWNFGSGTDGELPLGTLLLAGPPTGIGNTSATAGAVNIYPNPANGIYTIQGLQPQQIVEVYNYLGQNITRFTNSSAGLQRLDISNFDDGIYLLQVINPDGSPACAKKLVKAN